MADLAAGSLRALGTRRAVAQLRLVTAGYWAFTSPMEPAPAGTAPFHDLGYSPVSLAFLFLLYEFMGIVTNLLGGWVGAGEDSTRPCSPDSR